MLKFKSFKCADVRDKIFSLLAMTKIPEGEVFVPDYSLSVIDVFKRVLELRLLDGDDETTSLWNLDFIKDHQDVLSTSQSRDAFDDFTVGRTRETKAGDGAASAQSNAIFTNFRICYISTLHIDFSGQLS